MELFFELMDYEFLIEAANKKDIKINGFMNIRKAPKSLLRNIIKMKFSNEKKFKELINDTFNNKSEQYKGKTLADFLGEFYLSSGKVNHSVFEVYGIFLYLYPIEASKLSPRISSNIENGKHIFSGLLDNDRDITEENCLSIIEKYLHIEDEISFIEKNVNIIEEMLEKIERKNEYTKIREIMKDKSLVDMCREIGDLAENYDESLIWLGFISLNIDFIKKEQKSLYFFNKLLFNILKRMNEELLGYKKDKIDSLSEECFNRNNDILGFNKIITSLNFQIDEFVGILNNYEQNIKELNEKVLKNVSLNFSESEPDIIVITKFSPDRIMDSIGNYKIVTPISVDSLSEINRSFKGVVYIDRGAIKDTKSLLKLEDYLESMNLKKVTIFAKNIEELAQNIIISKFTMEG